MARQRTGRPAEDLVAERLAAARLEDRRAQRPHPLRRARHRRRRRPGAGLRRGQGGPRGLGLRPGAPGARGRPAQAAAHPPPRHRLDDGAPRRPALRRDPLRRGRRHLRPRAAACRRRAHRSAPSELQPRQLQLASRRPTGTSGGAAARSRSARSPRGARGSSSRRAPRSPSRVLGGRRRACSGRGSPWRSPRRRRSRRWSRRPRPPRGAAPRSRGSEKPSTRQVASSPGASRSSALRERLDVGHVQAARVDPAHAADDDADPRRRPQHARVHLQPALRRSSAWSRAGRRARGGRRGRAPRSRSGPRRRPAARPGSRARPRRRRRRSGSAARGRRRTAGGCAPACARW